LPGPRVLQLGPDGQAQYLLMIVNGGSSNSMHPSVAVLAIIRKFAINSSLSHALDYRDSRAPPIKFEFLLRFKSVVRSRWIANNVGWHHALLCCSAGARSVSQPLTPRVKSVMPPTSTGTYVDSVFDENVRLWPRADMRQCTHAAVKPRCAQIPHVSNDLRDGTSELLSSKQQLQSGPLKCMRASAPA
jgi:hypothetical protein